MTHRVPAPKCASHAIYRLTCEDYDRLVARAGGRCELCGVCGEDTPHRILHIDHDPAAGPGAVRGLLCSRCNTRLGRGLVAAEVAAEWLARPYFQNLDRETWRQRWLAHRRAHDARSDDSPS